MKQEEARPDEDPTQVFSLRAASPAAEAGPVTIDDAMLDVDAFLAPLPPKPSWMSETDDDDDDDGLSPVPWSQTSLEPIGTADGRAPAAPSPETRPRPESVTEAPSERPPDEPADSSASSSEVVADGIPAPDAAAPALASPTFAASASTQGAVAASPMAPELGLDWLSPPDPPIDRRETWAREAHVILTDAMAQADLLVEQAEKTAAEIVQRGTLEAQQQIADGEAAAVDVRRQAQQRIEELEAAARAKREELDAAQSERQRELDILLAARRDDQARQLEQERDRHHADLAEAEDEQNLRCAALLDGARAEADQIRAEARDELQAVREQIVQLAADAKARNDASLAESRETIAVELAQAREQTDWTRRTVASLIATVESDVQRTRQAAIEFAREQQERAKHRIRQIVSATRAELAQEADRQAADVQERRHQVEALEAAAAADAERVRQEATTDARRFRQEAANDAAQMRMELETQRGILEDRAQRRLVEAETGARAIRERAAADLTGAQEESRAIRQRAQDEASRILVDANADADQLRSEAHLIVAEARAKVSALTAQRDEIGRQLSDLSGVINALATTGPQPEAPLPLQDETVWN